MGSWSNGFYSIKLGKTRPTLMRITRDSERDFVVFLHVSACNKLSLYLRVLVLEYFPSLAQYDQYIMCDSLSGEKGTGRIGNDWE